MKAMICVALATSLAAGFSAASTATHVSSTPAQTLPTASKLLLARADNPVHDTRDGRHRDDPILKSKGADDRAGDLRRGRRADDPVLKSRGTDDPPGDNRRGRRLDDGPNHH